MRDRSKGERRYAWAWTGTTTPTPSPADPPQPDPNTKGVHEVAFYLCSAPQGRPVTLRTLVRIAGRRWPVEEDFQTGKDAIGPDHSQVRTYPALLRHLVLAMAAPAICAVTPPAPAGSATGPASADHDESTILDCRTRR